MKYYMRERQHDLRGMCVFNKQLLRINAKYHYFIKVKEVHLALGQKDKIFMFMDET